VTGPLRVANGRFARGFNCAQSVFSAFAGRYGVSSELALRLASAFGAGVARQGELCGALSGALMVIGLQYGQVRPEGKEQLYGIAREFMDRFQVQHGSLLCRELLGHDISTPEGLQAARDANAFAKECPLLVDETAKALTRFLDDHPLP
jgi:C_GCAxxG_C_C family probable redox protein